MVKICQNCGAQNNVDAGFCVYCGSRLTPVSAQTQTYYPTGQTPYPTQPYTHQVPYAQAAPPKHQLPQPPIYIQARNAEGATAAMVIGIIGILILPMILGIIALIFGISARNKIIASVGYLQGMGMAVAGIALGIIDIIWGILIFIIILSVP